MTDPVYIMWHHMPISEALVLAGCCAGSKYFRISIAIVVVLVHLGLSSPY